MRAIVGDESPSLPSPSRRSKFSYEEVEALEESAKGFKEYAPTNKLAAKFSGLCFHCKWSTVFRTQRMNEPRVKCGQLEMWVPVDIIECNSYKRITDMGLQAMAEMAWPIDPRDHLKDGYR